jgi:hypothetical protein
MIGDGEFAIRSGGVGEEVGQENRGQKLGLYGTGTHSEQPAGQAPSCFEFESFEF